MKRMLTVLCVALAMGFALAGCGGGGGDDPAGLTPASFAGSWLGQGGDFNGPHTYQIDVDASGNITEIYENGMALGLTGTITASPDSGFLFDIALSDGTYGGLMSDATASHVTYFDDNAIFMILQKDAVTIPDFASTDIQGSWMGYSIDTDATFALVGMGASNATVDTSYNITGNLPSGSFSGSFITSGIPTYSYFIGDIGTEHLMVFLSPDKQFAASYVCGLVWMSNFPECTFSLWQKL